MKNTYYGFKIGQKVVLNESISVLDEHFDCGTEFVIDSISRYHRVVRGHWYCISGKTEMNKRIICDINQIIP